MHIREFLKKLAIGSLDNFPDELDFGECVVKSSNVKVNGVDLADYCRDIQLFHTDDIAHSQADLELDVVVGTSKQFTVPLAGTIVALAASSNAPIAKGAVTLELEVGGAKVAAFSVVLNAINQSNSGNPAKVVAAGDIIKILASTTTPVSATAIVGTEENAIVTVTVTATGEAGNAWTIVVEEGAPNGALSAALVGTDITVTLGMDAEGNPDAAKNTGTLVAAELDALADSSAATSGTGAGAVLAAEAVKNFTGGVELDPTGSADITVSLAFKL